MFTKFHRRHFAMVALLFLGILTLLPGVGVTYTMWGNMVPDLHALRGDGVGELVSFYREVLGGRPQVWLMHPIDMLLSPSQGAVIHQGAKLVLGVLCGLMIMLAVARFTGARGLGLLVGTLYWATLQNRLNFDLFNPSSFAHQIALILFLVSVVVASYGRGWRVWLAALILLLSAILYEAFALLGVLTLFAAVWGRLQKLSEQKTESTGGGKFFWKQYLLILLPFVVVGAGFGLIYQLSSIGAGGEAEGSQLGEVMSGLPWKVYQQYTVSGLPLYDFFQHDLPINRQILFASGISSTFEPFSFADVISQLRVAWLARAALVAGLFFWGGLRLKVSRRILLRGLVFGLMMVALPNAPIAVAEMHQNIFQWHAFTAYITTCVSHIGWCVLLAVLSTFLIRMARKFRLSLIAKAVVCGVLAFGGAAASVMTDYWNQHSHGFEERFGQKWEALDVVLRSDAFKEVPDGAVVLAPALFETRSLHEGLLYDWEKLDYWTEYIQAVSAREVTVVRDAVGLGTALADGEPCYYIGYNEETTGGQSLVLGEIDPAHGGAAPRSPQAWVWDFSGRPDFQIVGRGTGVSADTGWWLFEDAGWFCARFPSSPKGRSVQGEVLDLGSLRTRGGEADPLVTPSGLGIPEYGEGWIPWHEPVPPDVRWVEGMTGEMTFYNRSASPVEVEVSLQFIGAVGGGNLQLYPDGMGEIHVILLPDGSSSGGVFRWEMKPGPNRLRVRTDVKPGTAYGREVTVGLRGVRLRAG